MDKAQKIELVAHEIATALETNKYIWPNSFGGVKSLVQKSLEPLVKELTKEKK